MTFDELLAADMAEVFLVEEGKPATYNGVAITVIPEIGSGKSRTVNSESRYEIAYFTVLAADVPEPKTGDIITYLGKDWAYDSLVESDGVTHQIQCLGEESAAILR